MGFWQGFGAGIIAILVLSALARAIVARVGAHDPKFQSRRAAFSQWGRVMSQAENLFRTEVDPHNEVLCEVQSLLGDAISNTVPLPKEACASDYWSKTVDWLVIYKLADAIIKANLENREVSHMDLKNDWKGLRSFKWSGM